MLANKPGVYEMSMPDDDQHTLKLQRVRSTDVGQLVVTASNQFGSDLCTLQLAMAGPIKFTIKLTIKLAFLARTQRTCKWCDGRPNQFQLEFGVWNDMT